VSTRAESLRRLRAVFATAGIVPEQQWRELATHFRKQELEKGTLWLRAGEPATQLGFVVEGVFRLYYTRRDGKQVNKSFIAENDFLASIQALTAKTPSRLSIEALSRATILSAPYEVVVSFYERDMFWQRLGRLLAERLIVKKLEREASLLMDPAAERYEAFLRDHPALEARVPDHHIARYLGITPEALSRLRRARGANQRAQRPPRRKS
jgi:CRP/FNR family transcriptional regulator, anaerobic regulatory protein